MSQYESHIGLKRVWKGAIGLVDLILGTAIDFVDSQKNLRDFTVKHFLFETHLIILLI
jgi:hypothetical protein